MNAKTLLPMIFIGVPLGIFCLWIVVMMIRFYRKVEQGCALIINCLGEKVIVTFTGGVVWPIINKAEVMDISVKAMEIERTGKNGLICEDNIRADIRVTFYVKVNKTEDDVLKVAQSVGCRRASTKDTLEELFQAKFSEALKTVGKQMEFITLFTERERFKEQIIQVIGEYLNGYKLEDVAIDYLEQTPLESLEANNILDAQGIRKIIDLTSQEAIATNEFQRNKQKVIKAQDVEAREKILELERQEADAEAKQQREIISAQSRETAEAEKVQAEERQKAEQARIIADESISVAEQNKERQIEVAVKAKERAIAIEIERVERDRSLEQVERERLVAVKTIEKEKAVEIEKKAIQDVIRERVMVEKTVAEEQEKIKDTVAFATADRDKQVNVVAAEREAEESLVKEVKAAEAKEQAAKSLYEETVTMAEADRVKAQKEAEAKKVRAEGVVAEESALGLAEVRVREADANAIELHGKAEATASREKFGAEAFGLESKGEAEAKAMTARYKANAEGTELQGDAEAKAMDAKFSADAHGTDLKADAMKKLDMVGRDHEEFKLKLGKQERIELAAIDVNRKIAEAQASVLGEAMKSADIDIVGGDGAFLETFFKSISLAKAVDGFADKSDVVKELGEGKGVTGVVDKIKELVGKEGLSSEDIKNLSLSALLAKLAKGAKDGTIKDQAEALKKTVQDLGMDSLAGLWLAK